MRVLQIIQKPQLRGAEIFTCQLSTELIKSGCKVDVLYLFDGQHQLQDTFPSLRYINLKASRKNRFWDVNAYKRLAVLIRQNQYDIVQANAGDTLKYAALSKLIHAWKAQLVFRNANKMSGFIKGRLHLFLTKFFLRQCDYIISVSENCRLDIISVFDKALGRSVTIPIGTYNFDGIAPINRENNEAIWINIGSFVAEKNHSFLIDLFSSYFKRHGKGYLWLVGGGKLEEPLRLKVRSAGLQDRVLFLGYQSNAISFLKASDILVMPSLIEGLPGVILEAFSCRVPVVASDAGGIPEVVKHNVTGGCITGVVIEEYLTVIERLLEDAAYRAQICTSAHELIEKEFLMPEISARFQACYRQLILEQEKI